MTLLGCKHNWLMHRKQYNPPPEEIKKVSGDVETITSLIYGITVIELRCSNCQDRQFRSTPGRIT